MTKAATRSRHVRFELAAPYKLLRKSASLFCKNVACHDQIDLNNIDQAVDYKINDHHHFGGLQTCKDRIKVCERFAQTWEEPIIHFSTFYVLL